MTGEKGLLTNYVPQYSGNVHFGIDHVAPIMGTGDIIKENIKISNVSYVEGLGHNLFSIGQFCDKGLEVNFKARTCSVKTENGDVILIGSRRSNLYTIDLADLEGKQSVCLLSKASSELT